MVCFTFLHQYVLPALPRIRLPGFSLAWQYESQTSFAERILDAYSCCARCALKTADLYTYLRHVALFSVWKDLKAELKLTLPLLNVSGVKTERVASYLQVFDNVDHLSSGVRVGDLALFGHGPQLPEGSHQFLQSGFRYTWSVLLQHLQLSLRLRIVHSVAAENITCAQDKGGCLLSLTITPSAGGACSCLLCF